MIQLPNNKKCYNLPEQVAQNLLNIQYLAEEYKNIDELPSIWQTYKETFDAEQETFAGWTTTFEGWDTTLATYLANMSSAAVSAIAGQNIAPANIAATGSVTAPSIIESMSGYSFVTKAVTNLTQEVVYAGAVKNGNKLTLVLAVNLKKTDDLSGTKGFAEFTIPNDVASKLYPTNIAGYTVLDMFKTKMIAETAVFYDMDILVEKYGNKLVFDLFTTTINNIRSDYKCYLRLELTFLLSDSLAS